MTTKAVLIRLPEKMLAEVDKQVSRGMYTSRADLIKDVLREKIEKRKQIEIARREIRKFKGIVPREQIHELTPEEKDKLAREHLREHGFKL